MMLHQVTSLYKPVVKNIFLTPPAIVLEQFLKAQPKKIMSISLKMDIHVALPI